MENLEKYTNIISRIGFQGILLVEVSGGNPVLEYKGQKLTHNLVTWESYSEDEVVEMIMKWKNNII